MLLCCRLYCDKCSVDGQLGVIVGNESLIYCYSASQDWYDQGFVERFIALVQHDAHIQRAGFKTDDMKVIMVMCPSPKAVIDEDCIIAMLRTLCLQCMTAIILLCCTMVYTSAQSPYLMVQYGY